MRFIFVTKTCRNCFNCTEFNTLCSSFNAQTSCTLIVTGTTEYGVTSTFAVTVSDSDFVLKSGDVNGDDAVDVKDLVRLKKHFAQMITLTGKFAVAADTDNNGKIDVNDLVILRKILLEIL